MDRGYPGCPLLAGSDAAREVKRADHEPHVQVEPARVGAIEADARVEMKLPTTEARRFVDQPVQQLPAIARAPGLRKRRQVIDVEVMAPGQAMATRKPATESAWSSGSTNTPTSR